MFEQFKGIDQDNAKHTQQALDTSKLEAKVDQLSQAILNKPETSFHPLIEDGILTGAYKQVKRGRILERQIKRGL